jgi:hypothetical protein
VVAQHPAHDAGRDAEEVRAVLPADILLFDEAEVGFVDEGGGLDGVAGALAPHVVAREPPQLVVDQRHQPRERRLVAVAPLDEQAGHLPGRCGLFRHLKTPARLHGLPTDAGDSSTIENLTENFPAAAGLSRARLRMHR